MSTNNILSFIMPGGKLTLIAEETANDSDKTITVTALKRWLILWVHVELTSTADAGNRTMEFQITDSADDVIWIDSPAILQAASEFRMWKWYHGATLQTAFENERVQRTLPFLVLDEGYKIRILDAAAIQPAADDMVIQMLVLEIDLGKTV